ncbi:bifunctional adenosine 5'-phosphosulfate phosphorylase/adenylylsulfatase HINT4 isoform X2 [Andrographis paniculata]|uniref:bifunctional adenosine 5'-phosphosulfate phosphorylase/adenylylsulfatase HINT4 isoform X2 n=1 Tax=Andrographis paniculata TaxID=175694 RepID=UPI0021E7DC75|nr:bifunctional adenosine 5'-phosphosulfate phosphorylase/adenylylsulfatase HINT4 isoform X2 [Andrographis paniculata]
MRKSFFSVGDHRILVAMAANTLSPPCIFCQIARGCTSAVLLHKDDKVVAFQDINPSAFRHYLVIPIEHIPTVKDLRRTSEDFALVSHMLNVGKNLLQRDASNANDYRFGFHQPPFNSVNHLHLHCFALPFTPRWKAIKYLSLGKFGVFIEAGKLLERIKPFSSL